VSVRRLLPEGWAPRPGGHVRILPDAKAAADAPPPPPGIWWVVDRAPDATHWWVMPHDGEAKVWATAMRAGRREMPVGWPAQSVPSRRLTPARTAVRAEP